MNLEDTPLSKNIIIWFYLTNLFPIFSQRGEIANLHE
jgi:hypothetical protein